MPVNLTSLLAPLQVIAIDIESDGNVIHEAGWAIPGSKGHLAGEDQLEAFLARLSGESPHPPILLGHNIDEWDLPQIGKRFRDFPWSKFKTIDTLKLQAQLTPWRRNLKLRSTHSPDQDAALALELFVTQLALGVDSGLEDLAGVTQKLAGKDRDYWERLNNDCLRCELKHPLAEAALKHLQHTRREKWPRLLICPEYLLQELAAQLPATVLAEGDSLCVTHTEASDPFCPSLRALPEKRSHSLKALSPWLAYKLRHSYGVTLENCTHCERTDCSRHPKQVPLLILAWSKLHHPEAKTALSRYVADQILGIADFPLSTLICHERKQWKDSWEVIKRLPHGLLLGMRDAQRIVGVRPADLALLGIEDCHRDHVSWLERRQGGAVVLRETLAAENCQESYDRTLFDPCITMENAKEIIFPGRRRVGEGGEQGEGWELLNPLAPDRSRYWQQFVSRLLPWLIKERGGVILLESKEELEKFCQCLKEVLGEPWKIYGDKKSYAHLAKARATKRQIWVSFMDTPGDLARYDLCDIPVFVEVVPIERLVLQRRGRSPEIKDQVADPSGKTSDLEAIETEADLPTTAAKPDHPDDPAEGGVRWSSAMKADACLGWLSSLCETLAQTNCSRLLIMDPRLPALLEQQQKIQLRQLVPEEGPDESPREALRKACKKFFPAKKPVDRGTAEEWINQHWQAFIEAAFLKGKGPDGGNGKLREQQLPYFKPVIEGRADVIVSLPTGGGKSLIFQGPALLKGAKLSTLSIVVAPLKALMVDQVRQLEELGFVNVVEAITGDLDRFEREDIYRRVASGEIWMIYVSPERLRSRPFMRALKARLDRDGRAEYWIFDEAHCLSQWGLDFRPDYHSAAHNIRELRAAGTGPGTPVLFFSATMTQQVREEIKQIYGDE